MNSAFPKYAGSLLALGLLVGLASCSDAVEPTAISDEERQELASKIEADSWIEAPVCTVEVFRQEADTTYGWAECISDPAIESPGLEQAESIPFRVTGDTVTVPGDGSQYSEDIREIFPADLVPTIEQYAGIKTTPASSE